MTSSSLHTNDGDARSASLSYTSTVSSMPLRTSTTTETATKKSRFKTSIGSVASRFSFSRTSSSNNRPTVASPTRQSTAGTESTANVQASQAPNSPASATLPDKDPPAPQAHSKVKEGARIAWHGLHLLTTKFERALDGTPAKGPVAALSALMDIGQVST
jgi:hypothetical protein